MEKKNFSIMSVVRNRYSVGVALAIPAALNVFYRLSKDKQQTKMSFLKVLCGSVVVVGGVAYTGWWIKKKADSKAYKENAMADADAYTIKAMADAMLYREKTEADIARHKAFKQEEGRSDSDTLYGDNEGEDVKDSANWLDDFNLKFSMPELPPFLEKIIRGVPVGYEMASILHLLSMLCAVCFSKVRSKYLDNNLHAPNLEVIIEASWGTGKAKFEALYKWLLGDIIKSDNHKVENMGHHNDEEDSNMKSPIIQIVGIGTSHSRLVDILAGNQGCHSYLFNSEVRALAYDLKKGNGLNFDYLRKAFENGDVCRNNRSKESINGTFPVYLNYTVTGTPNDIKFSFQKELEGGTLSRIAWATIPPSERELPVLNLPEGKEADDIHRLIMSWKSKFSYQEDEFGEEFAAQEHVINLDYICTALKGWLDNQYTQGEIEHNPARKDVRARMATIAFHCGMALHMLWGEPNDAVTRQKVVDMTIYIANYCAERFLHKFGKEHNEQRKQSQEAEKVYKHLTPTPPDNEPQKVVSKEEEDAIALKKLYDSGLGQKKIAEAYYGQGSDTYKQRVKRTLEKFYPGIKWGEERKNKI